MTDRRQEFRADRSARRQIRSDATTVRMVASKETEKQEARAPHVLVSNTLLEDVGALVGTGGRRLRRGPAAIRRVDVLKAGQGLCLQRAAEHVLVRGNV